MQAGLFGVLTFSTLAFADAAKGSGESVWIQKADGGIACNDGKEAQALVAGAQELTHAGVTVLESRKQNDGQMRAAVCGIPTGNQNSYRIPKAQVAKAKALQFKEVVGK